MTSATTTVRCPMRECRRRIDLDALPAFPERPCLHFIAGWREEREIVGAVLLGLEGDRELTIRNLRPREPRARALIERADQATLRQAIAADLDVVDDVAAFGDPHQRARASRNLAQLIIGPDPLLGGGPLR